MTLTPAALRLDSSGHPCGQGHIAAGKTCHKKGSFPTGKAVGAGLTAAVVGAALLHKSSRKAIFQAPGKAQRFAQAAVTTAVHKATAPKPSMKLTPKAFEDLRPPSKTSRLATRAREANIEAEKAFGKAASAEVERAVAVGKAMHKAGKAARLSLHSTGRELRLRTEAARRRFEPGYRGAGWQRKPRADGPSTDYYRTHPEANAKKVRHQAAINRRPEERERRVALNRERRQRGIDGKGGPDVSHTSSGGTVLENASTNRARNGAGGKPKLKADDEDGKKYTKIVTNPETGRKNRIRYGAKGYSIAPGTDKGDRYCARSFGDMKSHGKNCSGADRNTPLCLSRSKWACSGKTSRRDAALTPGKS